MDKRLKLLYIARILSEQTDDEHSLGVGDIISELNRYGISAERKAVYSDIELLRDYGMDIICERGVGNNYHVGSRDFELAELKLLVDAVESSRFITPKKSAALILKLQALASKHQAKQLDRQVFVSDRIKAANEDVYYNIDAIHTAITEKKKVAFRYFDYDITGKKCYRYNGAAYIVSPYGLTWVDENYYLIGYYDRRGDICHFRVDKMNRIKISDDSQIYIGENVYFNIADYVKKVFHMYSGTVVIAELLFDNSLLNVALDRFGKDARLSVYDEHSFILSAEVCVSPTLLSWLYQFGGRVKILSPQELINNMKDMAKEQLALYP